MDICIAYTLRNRVPMVGFLKVKSFKFNFSLPIPFDNSFGDYIYIVSSLLGRSCGWLNDFVEMLAPWVGMDLISLLI